MKAIINAELVMRDHLIPEAVLFIEGDKIAGFGEMRTTTIPEGCEIIDAKGAYVGPGFVDIHCHSGDEIRFHIDPLRAARFHLTAGTTSVLPTLGYGSTTPQYLEYIPRIREAMSDQVQHIVESIRTTLENTPPELASDIYDTGIMLSGGGALLSGLDLLISRLTGIRTVVAKSPIDSVAIGIGRMIESGSDMNGLLSYRQR